MSGVERICWWCLRFDDKRLLWEAAADYYFLELLLCDAAAAAYCAISPLLLNLWC